MSAPARVILAVSVGAWLVSAVGVVTTARPAWVILCLASGVLTGAFARIVYEERRVRRTEDG